jgi:hypothetical protein
MKKTGFLWVLLLVVLSSTSVVSAATGTVTILPMRHGTVVPSAETADVGKLIVISVQPDSGFRLVEGSLTLNGQPIYGTTFPMPASGTATIAASFERVPLPGWAVVLLASGALVVLVVGWVGVARSRKRRKPPIPGPKKNVSSKKRKKKR